jgi:hypothetical protein
MLKCGLKGIFVILMLLLSVTLASCDLAGIGLGGVFEDNVNSNGTEIGTQAGVHVGACTHKASDWIVDVEASCTEKGKRHKECKECGEVLVTEEIELLEHTLPPENQWTVVYAPDYGTGGLMRAECSVCGAVAEMQEEMWQYSNGLEYTSSADGSCFVSGIGGCEDTAIYIPVGTNDGKSVTSIGEGAFADCKNIEAVFMSGFVREIGAYAFKGCSSLKFVEIRKDVASIGDGAFAGCTALERIDIEEGNRAFELVDGFFIDIAEKRIIAYIGNASNPAIPEGIVAIGAGAFKDRNIVSITLPSSVTEIGAGAFEGCDALKTVNYQGTSEQWEAIPKTVGNFNLFETTVNCADGIAPETVRWYGRSTISGKAAYVYDALESAIMGEVPLAKIELDESMGVTVDDFYLAQTMFISDHPECFWWNGRAMYYQNSDEHLVSIEPEYTYLGEQLASMKAELEAVTSEILKGMPDGSIFEKALYLHDAVAERVTYTSTSNDQNPYGALVEGAAVCNGYATAYQMLLQEAGIRAWTVNGMGKSEPHAWNVIWMSEDACVYTDVTWDDQGENIYHYYFNMSLEEIDDDHSANEIFELPECDHTSWSCIDVDPDCNILSDESQPGELVAFFGEENNGTRTAQFFFLGVDFEKWFNSNAAAIYSLLDCDGFSLASHGNEYIITATGIK